MIKPPFLALYSRMGAYQEADGVPELVGFDCPFDDSFVVKANTEAELERRVRGLHDGTIEYLEDNTEGEQFDDHRGINPDVIVDSHGVIQTELYRRVCDDPGFDPSRMEYSWGKETLPEFWEREKHRWIQE